MPGIFKAVQTVEKCGWGELRHMPLLVQHFERLDCLTMLQSFLIKRGSQSQPLSWPSWISVCFCTPSCDLERRSAWDSYSTEVSLELSSHVMYVMARGAAGAAVHEYQRVYMMAIQIFHTLYNGCVQPSPLHLPQSSGSLSKAKAGHVSVLLTLEQWKLYLLSWKDWRRINLTVGLPYKGRGLQRSLEMIAISETDTVNEHFVCKASERLPHLSVCMCLPL